MARWVGISHARWVGISHVLLWLGKVLEIGEGNVSTVISLQLVFLGQ